MLYKEEIIYLLQQGVKQSKIVKQLGCSRSLVCGYAKDLGIKQSYPRKITESDYGRIQELLNEGLSLRDIGSILGVARSTISRAIKKGNLEYKPLIQGKILAAYLEKNGPPITSDRLKLRMLAEGLKNERCEKCDLGPEWHDEPLTLHMHHVNGQKFDNRLENLKILCPNCHAQTSNYAGKNNRAKINGIQVVA